MDIHKTRSEADKHINARTENQQQIKKDKLGVALRDNLRRRKAANLPSSEADGEDSAC